jgi:hypothetical protein
MIRYLNDQKFVALSKFFMLFINLTYLSHLNTYNNSLKLFLKLIILFNVPLIYSVIIIMLQINWTLNTLTFCHSTKQRLSHLDHVLNSGMFLKKVQ